MIKFITVSILGLLLSACTIKEIPSQEPGSLVVVCPNGKTFLNVGENKKNCFDFMEPDTTQ